MVKWRDNAKRSIPITVASSCHSMSSRGFFSPFPPLCPLTHCSKMVALLFQTATVPPIGHTHRQLPVLPAFEELLLWIFFKCSSVLLIDTSSSWMERKNHFFPLLKFDLPLVAITWVCVCACAFDMRDRISATPDSLFMPSPFAGPTVALWESAAGRAAQCGCPWRWVIISYDDQVWQQTTWPAWLFWVRSNDLKACRGQCPEKDKLLTKELDRHCGTLLSNGFRWWRKAFGSELSGQQRGGWNANV